MDMFPTTLAALGVTIGGERLGLGTNLYSERPTLVEELGLDYINEEIPKNSQFYISNILGISSEAQKAGLEVSKENTGT